MQCCCVERKHEELVCIDAQDPYVWESRLNWTRKSFKLAGRIGFYLDRSQRIFMAFICNSESLNDSCAHSNSWFKNSQRWLLRRKQNATYFVLWDLPWKEHRGLISFWPIPHSWPFFLCTSGPFFISVSISGFLYLYWPRNCWVTPWKSLLIGEKYLCICRVMDFFSEKVGIFHANCL